MKMGIGTKSACFGDVSYSEAKVFCTEEPEQGSGVCGSACVPVAVNDEPVAEVLDFTDGNVFE